MISACDVFVEMGRSTWTSRPHRGVPEERDE